MDLGTLFIDKLIVHDVPKRLKGQESDGPILSEIESPSTAEIQNYFKEKTVGTLKEIRYEVADDPGADSPVPGLSADLLSGQRDLVPASQEMAKHLFECQSGVNSAGLLVVGLGVVGSDSALILMKLQREEGVRVRQESLDGNMTFNIEHVQNLLLTDQTRVFKAGLFVASNNADELLDGLVSDNQRGYSPRTEIASFFLRDFLGCQLRESADVKTKEFFESSENFINEQVKDPVRRTSYQSALIAEMNSNRQQIRPQSFAASHLRGSDRARFVAYLRDNGVTGTVVKDTALVRSQISRIQVDLESGISVIASSEAFDSHVELEALDDDQVRMKIEDKLKRVKGRGRG